MSPAQARVFKVWIASLAGEIKLYNGLRPGEKRAKARGEEPAAHGGEECAALMGMTMADALGLGSQTPICRRIPHTKIAAPDGAGAAESRI